jgi:GAF domain-containing protein
MPEEALALNSLARAMSGGASLADIGSLIWLMVRQIVPCDAICLFVTGGDDSVCAQYAAGLHASFLRGAVKPVGGGVAGWVAANRRAARNADPALDFGTLPAGVSFQGSLAVPLLHDSNVVAVLSLYSVQQPYTEDIERQLSMLAPHLASVVAAVPSRVQAPWLANAERSSEPVRARHLHVVRGSA